MYPSQEKEDISDLLTIKKDDTSAKEEVKEKCTPILTMLLNKNPSKHFSACSSLNFMGVKFRVRCFFEHAFY
jgi:hypothetical protein